MAEIPKLIKDTSEYFNYEGSANPTTQDEMQAFLKNLHGTVVALTDTNLWQSSTVYKKGKIIHSPNMQAGYFAVALVEGTSGTNEPSWGDGTSNVTDGSISWLLTKGNITVNGVQPDATGNITIDIPKYVLPIATQAEVNAGTNNAKAVTPKGVEYALQNTGYWKANEYVTVGTIRFLKGAKYAGYYLKCTTAGTTGTTQPAPSVGGVISVNDGTAKWTLYYITNTEDISNISGSKINWDSLASFTASLQAYRSWVESSGDSQCTTRCGQCSPQLEQIDATTGQGSFRNYRFKILTGISSGTYTLKDVIQKLINGSHSHRQEVYLTDCNCDCGDG